MKAKQTGKRGLLVTTGTALIFAAASIALTAPALAHHSRTMFDDKITQVLRGSIIEFDFVNPHAFIIMEVRNEDGSSTTWQLEGGNAMGMIRQGWRPDSLRAGDLIEVEIHPLRSGAPGGEWRSNGVMLFEDEAATGIRPLDRDA